MTVKNAAELADASAMFVVARVKSNPSRHIRHYIVRILEDWENSQDEIGNPSNRVDRSANGTFLAIWNGRVVYENGRGDGKA